MLKIAARVASQKTRYIWAEQLPEVDVLYDLDEGEDPEMHATHHNLNIDDLDSMVDEFKSPLSPESPVLAENNEYHQDEPSYGL